MNNARVFLFLITAILAREIAFEVRQIIHMPDHTQITMQADPKHGAPAIQPNSMDTNSLLAEVDARTPIIIPVISVRDLPPISWK